MTHYSWRRAESEINSLPNFTVPIGSHTLHFVHERGSGANPSPLVLLHGWPYSFKSYLDIVPRLAHPERFGGKMEDAYTVVVPSLPGFAWSSKPSFPTFPREIAGMVNTLMTETLGYKRYIAHGGDWGSYTSSLLGFYYPENCVGVHITMSSVRHHGGAPRSGEFVNDEKTSEEEKEFAKKEKDIWEMEKAYNLIMGMKPLKLAYAMMDSPVGVAAWMLDSFYAWADSRAGTAAGPGRGERRLEDVIDIDLMLDEVMIYLVTGSFNSSMWIYTGDHEHGSWTLPEGRRVEVAVGVLATPDPVFPMPPRAVLERSHRVVCWRDAQRGGHFPFWEIPDVLIEELVEFRREVIDSV
jgi:microsomal epoxide hydrolase